MEKIDFKIVEGYRCVIKHRTSLWERIKFNLSWFWGWLNEP